MCETVVINRGEKELQTVRQFEEHFNTKIEIPNNAYDVIDKDCCLCQIDVAQELTKLNVAFKYDHMDYYVGQLDKVDENWLSHP